MSLKFVKIFLLFSMVLLSLYPHYASSAGYDTHYKGVYYWGEGVNAFTPCKKNISYWISARSSVLGRLKGFVAQNTKVAYQPVYIEFRGHLLDEELEGFAADYNGLVRVSEIYLLEKSIPSDCEIK